jgi:PAS domain S-box-containing protein
MPFQNKIQAGFALALAFLLLIGVSAWWSAQRNMETFHSVDHTYEVLDHLEDTLVDMLNAETGSRGFVISGDEAFLQPYQAGVIKVQKSFAAAKQLTQDNPNQQRRLTLLEPMIQKKIAGANEAIKLRRSGDTAGAIQFIAVGQGQQTMDEIRKLINEMEDEEGQLLQQRTATAQALSRTTLAIVAFGGLLALGLVGLSSVIVRRAFAKRQQAEAERDRFFTLALDMLGIANTDGYFKRVNPAFTATLGWSAEEMLARPFLDFTHPDDRAAMLREVEKLAAGQSVIHFESRYQHKDGSWRWLSWKSVPQPDGAIYACARDVTEIKRAEAALHRSEENLAVTLNSIGDAVLATDTEGRVTRMNPIAEKLTGWTYAEAQGRPIAEVFHIINEETRQPVVIPVEKVLASGKIQGLANHTIVIARDGTERPIADSAAPIHEKDGLVLGVVLVFRDVTKEKRAEKAIRESEQRLRVLNKELERRVAHGIMLDITERKRAAAKLVVANKELVFQNDEKEKRAVEMRQALAMLDAAEDGVFIFDPETLRFTYVNQGAIRQLGYTQAELLGMTYVDIKPNFDEAKFRELLAPMLRGEVRTRRFTTLHRHKDGHNIPVEINLQCVAPDGERQRFICMARDITERTREEESLRRFATVVKDSNDAITIQDFEGRITAWNRGAERMYGYSEAEALLMNIMRLTTSSKVAEQKDFIRRLIAGEAITSFETQRMTKDGRVLDVWMTVTKLLDEVGKPVGLASTERDITERLKNERVALRSQRLESIGTLAGGVAHDLNNSLAPIMMSGALLRRKYPGESQTLDMIESCAKRGADMVRQLLTFAKGAEGERVALQPDHLVKELERLMKGSFPKNIQLVVKCDPKLPLVLGDATQLHQVLLNLCVNARDAMPNGGTLTLEAQRVEVDATYASSVLDGKPGHYLMLRVLDTGTGIPPEIIDRIFDPFFTTKSPDKGTGLGLSTVMGIVKGHGGFLHVYSQPGKGSTFAVYLPAALEDGDTEHWAKAAAGFRGQGETVLFVDDEPDIRMVARGVLQHLNFKPLIAADGADGLIQVTQHRTELRVIITDLHMPHMDGLAFVREIRRMLPDIPIVLASGRMEAALAGEFKTLGVTNRLDKPFTEQQLAEALKTVLQK